MKENFYYEIECTREGYGYMYHSETCRNAYSRRQEHLKGVERRDRNSVLVKHVRDKHSDEFLNVICEVF